MPQSELQRAEAMSQHSKHLVYHIMDHYKNWMLLVCITSSSYIQHGLMFQVTAIWYEYISMQCLT